MRKRKPEPWTVETTPAQDHAYSDQYADAWQNHTAEDYDRAIQTTQTKLVEYHETGEEFQVSRTERIIRYLTKRRAEFDGRPNEAPAE